MRNKFTLNNYRYCLILLISIYSVIAYAQENGINELQFERTKNTNSKAVSNNASKKGLTVNKARGDFNNLVYNLWPTVYIENGSVKTIYGDGNIIKMTLEDASSISSLNSLISQYRQTQLLTINLKSISDLNTSLDLSSLSVLRNLKYLFIKCRFNCNESIINQFINRNSNISNIRVFYLCGESE